VRAPGPVIPRRLDALRESGHAVTGTATPPPIPPKGNSLPVLAGRTLARLHRALANPYLPNLWKVTAPPAESTTPYPVCGP